jgi:hypothetical protein
MRLFDAKVPLAGPKGTRLWCAAFKPRPPNPATEPSELLAVSAQIEAARRDPEVLRHLHADIQLHEAAKRLFDRQASSL